MFAGSFGLLVFGAAVYFSAPSNPGYGFWTPERLIWGVLPACGSVALFAWASQHWARAYARRRFAGLALGAIVVLFAAIFDCVLYWKLRPEPDAGIGVSWDGQSGTFDWGRGRVKLPPRFTYARLAGIDSTVGQFTSAEGTTVIKHDIGELGGGLSGPQASEMLMEGSRVRFRRTTHLDGKGKAMFWFELSFPDSGCAKFSLGTFDERDKSVIASLANSFQPSGRTPSWIRSLLPGVLRSDCRLVPNPDAQFLQ